MSDVLTRPRVPQATRGENAVISDEIKPMLSPLTSKVRLPQLDGIRGLAILLVLIWHYVVLPLENSSSHSLRFVGRFGIETWTGVDLFFVLSGFLIGGILIDMKGQAGYFRTFYTRRVFRILPMYFLLFGAFSLWQWLSQMTSKHGGTAMPQFVYATFTQNFWLMHHPWDAWMGHTWSLAVEEQFYLTLPFVVWVLPGPKLWKATVGIVLGTLLFRSLMYLRYYPDWSVVAYASLFCRADALMLGVLGAILVRSPRWFPEIKRRRNVLFLAVATCVLACFIVTAKGWGMMTRPISTLGYTLIAASYLLLILGAILSDGLLKRMFCMRWLRGLGTISYGLYMVHPAVLILVYSNFGYEQPRINRALDVIPMFLAVALSVGVAYLSWNYFESKLLRFGHRVSSRQRALPVAA
jgi:peptidoglycan/LPS O-acetylase OafA/YrhL